MAYFHSKYSRTIAGKKRAKRRRVVGETFEEMLTFSRSYPDVTTINVPPKSFDSYKSHSLPEIWLQGDREDILEAVESTQVPDSYISLLTWWIREELYYSRVGKKDEEVEKFFLRGIRGKLRDILKNGDWIDEPKTLSLKLLHNRMEKIDLGRRNDLNFSSDQPNKYKYNPDTTNAGQRKGFRREEVDEKAVNWTEMYKNGDKETRESLLLNNKWLEFLIKDYGPPDDPKFP